MYVLYNIQGNVLLTKLMRKLYQILYTVGRLTYAPARRAFFFLGDTWAVGFSLSGGHLGSGRFPFRGTLEQWAGLRGKGARSYEARFSPSRSPFPGTSLFCVVVCYNVSKRILYSSVLVVWGLCRSDGCVVNVTPNSSYLPYPREQARCAGRFPVRRNKKIGST